MRHLFEKFKTLDFKQEATKNPRLQKKVWLRVVNILQNWLTFLGWNLSVSKIVCFSLTISKLEISGSSKLENRPSVVEPESSKSLRLLSIFADLENVHLESSVLAQMRRVHKKIITLNLKQVAN